MMSEPKEISASLIQAWADFCGIDPADERAQFPHEYGWPENFHHFGAGWSAALVIWESRIAEQAARIAELEQHISYQAWADFCGIDPADERAHFGAGWSAALVIWESRIAEQVARIAELEQHYQAYKGAMERLEAQKLVIAELEADRKRLRIFAADLYDMAANGALGEDLLAMRGVAALTKDLTTESEIKEAYSWLEQQSAGGDK